MGGYDHRFQIHPTSTTPSASRRREIVGPVTLIPSSTVNSEGTMIPVATRPYGGHEYPNSPPTKPYHAGDDDERYCPHRDDELLFKIAGVPISVASRPVGVDEYGHGSPKKANPARDDGKPRDVATKRAMVPAAEMLIRNAFCAQHRAPKPSAKNPFPNPTCPSSHGPDCSVGRSQPLRNYRLQGS